MDKGYWTQRVHCGQPALFNPLFMAVRRDACTSAAQATEGDGQGARGLLRGAAGEEEWGPGVMMLIYDYDY